MTIWTWPEQSLKCCLDAWYALKYSWIHEKPQFGKNLMFKKRLLFMSQCLLTAFQWHKQSSENYPTLSSAYKSTIKDIPPIYPKFQHKTGPWLIYRWERLRLSCPITSEIKWDLPNTHLPISASQLKTSLPSSHSFHNPWSIYYWFQTKDENLRFHFLSLKPKTPHQQALRSTAALIRRVSLQPIC